MGDTKSMRRFAASEFSIDEIELQSHTRFIITIRPIRQPFSDVRDAMFVIRVQGQFEQRLYLPTSKRFT